MFCLGIDRAIQIIPADTEPRIAGYKIVDTYSLLFEKQIYYYDLKICFQRLSMLTFHFETQGKYLLKT